MPYTLRLAMLLGTVASVASAQAPCNGATRDLADASARTQLADLAVRGAPARDLMADGASCSADSAQTKVLHSMFGVAWPVLRMQYVGGVPDRRGNGDAWTGLGLNAFARVGVTFDRGPVHAVFAPEVWFAQNRNFAFFPGTDSARSPFASNWYTPPYSIDVPTRYGASSVTQLGLGQSALWATFGNADIGASNASQSWGPGLRGHLLLGPDAPGIPRLFARTNRPVTTPAGAWSGTAFIGTLTESPFFDRNSANDLRTLTAWTIAWSPTDTSGTAIGIAHASMRTGSLFGGAHPLTGPSDQMNSLYARVQSPVDGLRTWVEVARAGALPGLHQFLTIPYQGITYLFGLQQAVKRQTGTLLMSAEMADLEQPTDIRGQPTQDFYTSNDIPQGWTQRGQILGDGIGPGGQSQWFAVDWVTPVRSTGVFVERVRWNEDAFLRQFLPYLNRHDVTFRAGVRAGTIYRHQELHVELSGGKRLNYLFQNGTYIPGYHTVDVAVSQIKFSITPLATRSQ